MAEAPQPLSGLTVVDFTQIGAGPTCTMILADLGARVIKIEAPSGDIGRILGPAWINGEAALFHGFNRNKESLAVDLKSSEGATLARRLMSDADIVVESMRPGAMDRLGLGETATKAVNPEVIYCSISAYGQTGPYAERAGVDGIVQADSGLMSLIGFTGAPPAKVQTPIVDVFTGYVAACGVLASLAARGSGPVPALDISLFRSALAMQQAAISSYLVDGLEPEKQGAAAPYSAPNEAFETADGWIMVAAYSGGRWDRLCGCLGCPDLASDPRFATSGDRVQNRAAMTEALSKFLIQRSTQDWFQIFSDADILCAPVSTYADVMSHPQVIAENMITSVQTPGVGAVRTTASALHYLGRQARPNQPAPALGVNPRAVLTRCGLSCEEIESLLASGAVVNR